MSNVIMFPAHVSTSSDEASEEIAAAKLVEFDLQSMEMLRNLLGNLHVAVLQLAQDLVRQEGPTEPVANSSGAAER